MLWGVVAGMVLGVDPALIKDYLLPDSYILFVVLITTAIWYSLWLVIKNFLPTTMLAILSGMAIELSILGIMNMFLLAVILASMGFVLWLNYRR